MTASPPLQEQKRVQVGILVFDKVEVLDFCGPFEVFSSCRVDPLADSNTTESPFEVFLIAESSDKPITTIGGMKVLPHKTLEECDDSKLDILVVPGGFGTRKLQSNAKILDFVQRQSKQVDKLCSVSTGALLLAQAAGVLPDGSRITTHLTAIDSLQKDFPKLIVDETLAVVKQQDGKLYTSTGISAGIKMALTVVKDVFGEDVARSTAKEMEYTYNETNEPKILCLEQVVSQGVAAELTPPAKKHMETLLEATSTSLPLQPKRCLEQVSQGVAAELAPPAKKHKTDVAKEAVVDESSCNFFHAHHAGQWTMRFKELCDFCKSHGHCQVPHTYPTNPRLACWVKRQRYQYKLRFENRAHTMTEDRLAFLEKIGFVWDTYMAAWEVRKADLLDYRAQYGHCNVPVGYLPNRQLGIWVKRQRRQYKFFCNAKPSSMTTDRIATLESLGFEWERW
jgi:transcriptional regulator GlxA family with amidase domain